MVSELNQTPKALRFHIGVFGDTNAGKSTFINVVTGQEIALTSPVAGTTTDPVFKPMELLPLGPVVFIDTAGLDDKSELGKARVKKSLEQLSVCDGAVLVINSSVSDIDSQRKYLKLIENKKIPVLTVVNEANGKKSTLDFKGWGTDIIFIDLNEKSSAQKIKNALINVFQDREEEPVLTGNLVKSGDFVMMITPQDIQAPKGRLILPEVQTLRDLLDNGCTVTTVTLENVSAALENMKTPPSLIITDSQVFGAVNKMIPREIPLTSFSVLMAKIKGDIDRFVKGAKAIDTLCDGDRVLILESCAHHAMDDDIARVKIPNLIKKYTGKNLIIDNVSGAKQELDVTKYKLAIHCGGCMLNRKAMLQKQKIFEEKGVPMTNFGVCIAHMNKILERVCY